MSETDLPWHASIAAQRPTKFLVTFYLDFCMFSVNHAIAINLFSNDIDCCYMHASVRANGVEIHRMT